MTDVTMSTMEGIPAPPPLMLPQISFSAPQSRRPSATFARPPRGAVSQPASPRHSKSKPKSPINKLPSPIMSPMRPLRRRSYHVTFSSHNPRTKPEDQKCPVHSYGDVEKEIAAMPSKYSVGGVKFGDTPREVLGDIKPNCPVHVYAAAKSELSTKGVTSFGTPEQTKATVDGCPVHAYADPKSSFRQHPATFGKSMTPRIGTIGSGPATHAYATPRSTLSTSGMTPFSTDARFTEYERSSGSTAPVHAYAPPTSLLRKTGAVAFGGTSARSSLLGSLSRTGLVPANATPVMRPPRTLKPLPSKPCGLETLAEAPLEKEAPSIAA